MPGAVTGTLGLLGIVYGLTRAGQPDTGWGDPWTIASLVAGVALLVLFLVIEAREEDPLLPPRIFRNRTRAVSFVVMMLVPAAMFAMFFFLSLFIQQVMGYSPLHAGFAFLPFSVGIVLGATVSSKLVATIDPRFIAGVGTLMATGALFGFSRLAIDDSPVSVLQAMVANGGHAGADVSYWTSILPFILLMSVGMGLTFVPLTLTAVHHVRAEDSGIGSGVLNTMQQVGGALGLATLATVSAHFAQQRAADVGPLLAKSIEMSGGDPQRVVDPQSGLTFLEAATFQASFTDGATAAFLTGAVMISLASLLIWTLLNVKHEELATDGPEAVVHVG